jgi:aspartyl protease family protein
MNDQQTSNGKSTHSIGKVMFIIAMLMGMGLLTLLFQDELDKQYNPNQQIETQTAAGYKEINLTRNRSGHYVGTGYINGREAVLLLDTGATTVAIPQEQAAYYGLKKGYPVSLSTANGLTTGYQTIIDELKLGEIHLSNVRAVITPNLSGILLGMSALKQLEFTQRGKALTIRQINPATRLTN